MGEFLLTPACCDEKRKSILQISITAMQLPMWHSVHYSVLQKSCKCRGLLKFSGAGV